MSSLLVLVASNLVVSSCIACLAWGVGRWGRSPALAHLLWVVVFIKLITPPVVNVPVTLPAGLNWRFESAERAQPAMQLDAPRADVAMTIPSIASAQSIHPKSKPVTRFAGALREVSVARCLVAMWLLGASLIFVRGLIRFAKFSGLLSREGAIDSEATEIVRRLAGRNRKFAPAVRRVSARVSPMLFGVGRSTCIVCPNRLWDQLTDVQREAFLAHEVAHFLRRDHWVRWLEWFVTALYWWLPLVYWARQQLERHEEAACDAWAVSRLQAPKRAYAETLLNVVDFLSDHRIGTPRIASRMQPTDALEERLRLIMSVGKESRWSTTRCGVIASIGLTMLLIHPIPSFALGSAIAASNSRIDNSAASVDSLSIESQSEQSQLSLPPLVSLPPPPRGWWNEPPVRTWADVRVGEHDLKLLAEAGIGISILRGSQSNHTFDSKSVRAIALVAASGRLIIANDKHEIHLWDVDSSQAVSLIGRHPDRITSIAFHPKGGLVSGDLAGNLLSWDIQSGQIQTSATAGGPVSSVRWDSQGKTLGVVVGDWKVGEASAQLLLIDGKTLGTLQRLDIPADVALAQQHAKRGWVAVDWSGKLWSLVTGDAVGRVAKESVSGVMLCQDIFDRIELLAEPYFGFTPPQPPPALEQLR